MRENLTAKLVDSLPAKTQTYEVIDHGGAQSVRGLRVRITRDGHKSYFVRYFLQGREHSIRIGSTGELTLREARERAASIRQQARDAALGRAPDPKPVKRGEEDAPLTLRAFVEQHAAPWYAANRSDGENTCSRVLRRYAELADRPLTEIDALSVERIRSAYAKRQGRPAAGNADLRALTAMLTKAVEWGFLAANPSASVRPNRTDRKRSRRSITREEEQALRQALADRDANMRAKRVRFNQWRSERGLDPLPVYGQFADYMLPFFVVALGTGMRHSELLGMKWEHVDLTPGAETIVVPGSQAKSGQTRFVPIAGEAVEVLTAWHRQEHGRSDYVFGHPDTGRRMKSVIVPWRGVRNAAGLDPAISPHTLRHTYATRALQCGVDLKTVSVLLGHSDVAVTAGYLHTNRDTMRAAVARLAENSAR